MKTVVKWTYFSTLKIFTFSNTNSGGEDVLKNRYFLCFIFILVLSGCSSERIDIGRQSLENRIQGINSVENGKNFLNKIETKGSMEEFKRSNPYNIPEQVEKRNLNVFDIEYNTKRAQYIAEAISKTPLVEETTVVITGNTALVGVDLASSINESQVNQLKKSIEEKTFVTDASLKNVSVTVSPEIVERISDISRNLSQGKPINGLAEEISSIIRRITPTV